MVLTTLQLHILKTHTSQYQNAKGQNGEAGERVSRGEVRGSVGGHAYSVVISWGELGKIGKGGYYKQLYHLNIALGSLTIPKKKPGTITHTQKKNITQKKLAWLLSCKMSHLPDTWWGSSNIRDNCSSLTIALCLLLFPFSLLPFPLLVSRQKNRKKKNRHRQEP